MNDKVETNEQLQSDCYEMIAEKYEEVGLRPASIVETSEYLADAWKAFQGIPLGSVRRMSEGSATGFDQAVFSDALKRIRNI